MRASQYVACAMMSLALLFSLACSGKLSRTTAGAILAKSMRLPAVESRTIDATYLKNGGGYFRVQSGYPPPVDFAEIEFFLGHSEIYTKALMTMTPGTPYYGYEKISFSPTEDGRQYVIGTTAQGAYNVRICEIVFGDVTGMQISDQTNSAVVEFSLRRTRWTPFGDFYKLKEPSKYPELVPPQRAELQKYDDGWRIKN